MVEVLGCDDCGMGSACRPILVHKVSAGALFEFRVAEDGVEIGLFWSKCVPEEGRHVRIFLVETENVFTCLTRQCPPGAPRVGLKGAEMIVKVALRHTNLGECSRKESAHRSVGFVANCGKARQRLARSRYLDESDKLGTAVCLEEFFNVVTGANWILAAAEQKEVIATLRTGQRLLHQFDHCADARKLRPVNRYPLLREVNVWPLDLGETAYVHFPIDVYIESGLV